MLAISSAGNIHVVNCKSDCNVKTCPPTEFFGWFETRLQISIVIVIVYSERNFDGGIRSVTKAVCLPLGCNSGKVIRGLYINLISFQHLGHSQQIKFNTNSSAYQMSFTMHLPYSRPQYSTFLSHLIFHYRREQMLIQFEREI